MHRPRESPTPYTAPATGTAAPSWWAARHNDVSGGPWDMRLGGGHPRRETRGSTLRPSTEPAPHTHDRVCTPPSLVTLRSGLGARASAQEATLETAVREPERMAPLGMPTLRTARSVNSLDCLNGKVRVAA